MWEGQYAGSGAVANSYYAPGMLTFDDIIGQDRAVRWLRAACLAGRLPHGLIFAGPAGVGKATTAAALAAVFLCGESKDCRPCGRCLSCRAMQTGAHPDYHVVVKELIRVHDRSGTSTASQMSIDVVREEVLSRAGRTSVLGGGKVFVIEQAELMTAAAQNAALKTLEEPAGRSLMMLLTDQPQSLLATIRSRCQTVVFAPLPDDVVRRELAKRGAPERDAADAADFAGGSLGLAMRWVEDGVVARIRELRDMLDGRSGADLADWLKVACGEYAQKQLKRDELASESQAKRDGMSLYLRLAAEMFRRRLAGAPDAAAAEAACRAIETLVQCGEYVEANVTISLVAEHAAAQLGRSGANVVG